MTIKELVLSRTAARTALQIILTTAALGFAPHAHATAGAAVIMMQQQQQQAQGASTAQSPQVCAPAGYVTSRDVGYAGGAVLEKGELRYCVLKDSSPLMRPQCAKYISAQEYVQKESGRPDAVYSGMALQGSSPTRIVLFYCLPKR